MKILIRDLLQEAENVSECLKSPSLADYCDDEYITGIILPDDFEKINCMGIGYTDATEIQLIFQDDSETVIRSISITKTAPYQNGLYLFDEILRSEFYESDVILTVIHNGTYIGRLGLGQYRQIGTSPTKELGFFTTTESRVSLSGSTIPGAGGYSGRTVDLDVRYKIDDSIYDDIERAMFYIMKSYPYFLNLTEELHKLPENMRYFYGATPEPITKLQSSSYVFKYSYRFEFMERF